MIDHPGQYVDLINKVPSSEVVNFGQSDILDAKAIAQHIQDRRPKSISFSKVIYDIICLYY